MNDMDDLPTGWVSARLEQVAVLNPSRENIGRTLDEPVHFVPMAAVRESFGGIDVSTTRPLREVVKGYTVFREGDVIFAKITPCMENGKLAVVPPLKHRWAFGSTEFHVLRSTGGVSPKWLAYFLSQTEKRRDAQRAMTGSAGQLRVPLSWLAQQVIPVPPSPEQRRIVAKIEELFSDLDAGVAALERVRANLKRYRASVLKAAVEGKLTEDWRAQHPDTEPATVLLERILTERRHQWEKAQLAKFAQAGKKPPKGWQNGYREPGFLDPSRLPPIPPNWTWVSCDALLSGFSSGSTAVPVDVPSDYPILRSSSVRAGRLDFQDARFLTSSDPNLVSVGDLLFVRLSGSVDYVASCALVRRMDRCPVAFPDRLFRAKPVLPILGGYIEVCFASPFCRQRIIEIAKSSAGHQRISSDGVTGQPMPLPSEDEIAVVVTEVERRLSIVDELESQVEANLKRAARLRQGILKRAFEGRLVPQDPTDEPADKLLERIRGQRLAPPPADRPSPKGRKPHRRKSQLNKPSLFD